MKKRQRTAPMAWKNVYIIFGEGFLKGKKCCWSVKKVDNLSVINILCESDLKSAAYSKKWRFLFVFLKLSVGYVVLELCLVYNIDIVFLKVSIKCRNAFLFFSFLSSVFLVLSNTAENYFKLQFAIKFAYRPVEGWDCAIQSQKILPPCFWLLCEGEWSLSRLCSKSQIKISQNLGWLPG